MDFEIGGIDGFNNQFRSMFDVVDLTPLYNEIGEILLRSVDRNFREGGRYDTGEDGEYTGGATKWIPSKRALEEGGQTLLDKGFLSKLNKDVSREGVTIGSNLVYAAIHQYGGTAGKDGKVIIDARPFLVIQIEDLEEIAFAAENFLNKLLL